MLPKLNNARALRIISAAREEFAKHGFAGARMDRIAAHARVNKQLLFYYYHSKHGLFQAVLAACAGELDAAMRATEGAVPSTIPPLERLRRMLDTQYLFFESHPPVVELLTQTGEREVRGFASAINRLVVLIAEGQGVGDIRDELDPHLVAAQALVLMVAYVRLEPLIALSAAPLGVDGPALSARWRDAGVKLVLDGIRAGEK